MVTLLKGEDGMQKDTILTAHGGCGLINRIIPAIEKESFIKENNNLKIYQISDADLSVFYRIADGALSPLTGPMAGDEFNSVLEKEYIERNNKKFAWTIPIAFPITESKAKELEIGETIFVKDSRGLLVGILKINDIYKFDKVSYNKGVYQTERTDHPGPRIVNDDQRDYLLGGEIWAFESIDHSLYGKYMLSPLQTRALFKNRNWQRIIGFQTRNALHRAHEYAMVYALEKLSKEGFFSGLVLNPLVGSTKKDDVPAHVRMATYEALIREKVIGLGDKDSDFWKTKNYDIASQLILVGLDMKMFYAGPKEAIMHAIYRQNYGFTDIVIGRKHADAPFDTGEAVWGDFDAHEKFENLSGQLLIKPVKVGFASFFEEINRVGLISDYKDKGYHPVSISGKELRKQLASNEKIDERIMRKPVSDILIDFYTKSAGSEEIKSKNITWHQSGVLKKDREARNKHKGAAIWLTGLPSSGKSTIAVELQALLFERGYNVYVLDGDNVRHGLNKNLGFSPEDREENIRRIGEVAKLFVDAGLITITAFISPYKKDRNKARSLFEKGDFIEVFVDTNLDLCEKRDPKGLYKKARSGEIKGFTGVSAPYEVPQAAELIIKTDNQTKQESAGKIIDYLIDGKYISA